MKKLSVILLLLFSLIMFINISGTADVRADEIQLNITSKTSYVGKSFKLKLKEAEGNVIWESLNPQVAAVENGIVTGISKGTTDIIARYDGKEYICAVKIWNAYLNKTDIKIKKDSTFQLNLKGTDALKWISSADSVASVDDTGLVTAHNSGNAKIYVFGDNGKQYSCTVLVYQPVQLIENPSFEDLAPTVNMSFEELVGDNGNYDYPEAFPVAGTYKLIIDLYHKVVLAYTLDDDGNYTVPVRYMLCSCGASATPTPTGTYKMESYRLRYELFAHTPSWAQYWSIITGRIYFHSILYTSDNAKDYTTTSWNNLGSAVSHGCVRLTVPDARWIWYNVAPGTTIEIRKGSSDDTATKEIRDKLVLAKLPDSRPNLKKGEIPDTDNWSLEDVLQEVPFVQGSQNGGEAAY